MRLVAGATPGRWHLLLEEIAAVTPARARGRALKRLTARETEVLSWLPQGKTNWEIGRILGVAEKTVGKHLENIFAKLHVENRLTAVRLLAGASAF